MHLEPLICATDCQHLDWVFFIYFMCGEFCGWLVVSLVGRLFYGSAGVFLRLLSRDVANSAPLSSPLLSSLRSFSGRPLEDSLDGMPKAFLAYS